LSAITKTYNAPVAQIKKRRRRNWTPYFLLLPSLIYLAMFFAWPMFRSLTLAFRTTDTLLTIRDAPDFSGDAVGKLQQNSQFQLIGGQGNIVETPGETGTEVWFHINGEDADGNPLDGWVFERTVRVDDRENDDDPATSGIIRRPRRTEEEHPTVPVYTRPGPAGFTEIAGQIVAETPVIISEVADVEIWYQLRAEKDNGDVIEGWAAKDFVDIINESEGLARVDKGDSGEWTTRFIERMINDRAFIPAVRTTFLLMALIIPIQFVVAITMSLVIQSRLKGNSLFLYVFSIPLGVSDLATGIVWFAIFTQRGYINSFLTTLGLVDQPVTFIDPDKQHFIILAIVLAEVWRATSIVMVIVVSGLQAIPHETLEAAELFGASFWQRLRHVILPMLKPSLQVALILRTILAFQVFAVVIAIAGRGTTVLANETFLWYDEFRNNNVAAAYAGFILLLSMITAIFYLRAVRTQEEKAG